MQNVKIGTWISAILIILTIFLFLFLTPGAINFWYKQGAGHSFGVQVGAGIEREVARPKAFSDGTRYAILMVFGFPLPLMLLILITICIISCIGSKTIQVFLKIAFLVVCIIGAICLGYAQNMVSWVDTGLLSKVFSASIIWLFFAVIAGFFIFISHIVNRAKPKKIKNI